MTTIHPHWFLRERADGAREVVVKGSGVVGVIPSGQTIRDLETALILRDAARRAKYSSAGLAAKLVKKRAKPSRPTMEPR